MIDIVREIEATRREVGEGGIPAGVGRAVRLQREYDAAIDEVWDAVTNPERIGRWFLPISGDYRIGGRYQLEGNAGGEIVACERPNHLKLTWVYGVAASPQDVSEVEIRLAALSEERTRFELEHTAVVPEDRWAEYGPGAVGVGWDGGVLGLALHLQGGSIDDPIAWQMSADGREFFTRSSIAWGEANRAAGADAEAAAKAVANTTAFYAPDPANAPQG
jgi:uncharacterized protein YndB with AHSA1/START domain